ncbi:MAG: hypothetical protein JWO90_487 [Solirubrobacterales bacterium]|nr:hypothetical protein [Solirubrobacterales bacterium]
MARTRAEMAAWLAGRPALDELQATLPKGASAAGRDLAEVAARADGLDAYRRRATLLSEPA